MKIFVVGNDEDGGFVHEYDSTEQLQEFLSSVSGCKPGLEPPYDVDVSNIEYDEDVYRFDGGAYRGNDHTFKIIEGTERSIEPVRLATQIELA